MPKKGRLKQFADLRGGGLARKRGLVFLRGGRYPNAHCLPFHACPVSKIEYFVLQTCRLRERGGGQHSKCPT